MLVALVLPLAVGATPASATPTAAADEAAFLAHANDLRSSRGLSPFQVDGELTAVARNWSARMAAAGDIWHNSGLASAVTNPRWIKLGENVGTGPSEISVHQAFVASPSHLVNLVHRSYTHIGLGVVRVGNVLFVTQIFMGMAPAHPAATASAASSAGKVAARPSATGGASASAPASGERPATVPPAPTVWLRLSLDQVRSLGV